jgi:DNA primase
MDAYILVVEEGPDPDSFLFEYGTESFQKAAENALSAVSFLIESAVKRHGLSPEGKIRIISDLQKPLSDIDDPVARSLYVKTVCERIDVDETAVMEKIGEAKHLTAKPLAHQGNDRRDGNMKTEDRLDLRHITREARMESRIVSMMLQFPSMMEEVRMRGLVEKFENRTLQGIARTVLGDPAGSDLSPAAMLSKIESDELRAYAASLAVGDESWDEGGCMKLLSQFEKSRTRRNRSLLQDIKAAEASDDPEALDRLLKEKMALARKNLPLKKRRDISNKVAS